ncbi:MAG: hypothetical protein ACRYG2_35395 [Janthinobacterium lividum]
MCGACGAGSARSATLHWSAPFLASVPARSAAARTLTRWSRSAGWAGTVNGVAGGFEVATSSGRRSLVADLAGTLEQLDAYGVGSALLLARAAGGVVEGPPTRPGRRPRSSAAVGVKAPVPSDAGVADASGFSQTLMPDPRRRHRVPGLLAWVAAAEEVGSLGPVTVNLGLDDDEGMLLTAGGAHGVTCDAGPAPVNDAVLGLDQGASAALVALLCPVQEALDLPPPDWFGSAVTVR